MPRFALVLAAFVASASPLVAQNTDCDSDDYLEAAMAHLESNYRSFPEQLFTVQLYLKEGFAQEEVKPDGKWGPRTERAVCSALQSYTKIGGSDGDWGIFRANHASNFTSWLLKAARANLSDGEIVFPD